MSQQETIVQNLFFAIIANNTEAVRFNLQKMGVIGNAFEVTAANYFNLMAGQNFSNQAMALNFVQSSLNVNPDPNSIFYQELLVAVQQYSGAGLGQIAAAELAKILPPDSNADVTPINQGVQVVQLNQLNTEQKIILGLAFMGLLFLVLLLLRAIQKIIR